MTTAVPYAATPADVPKRYQLALPLLDGLVLGAVSILHLDDGSRPTPEQVTELVRTFGPPGHQLEVKVSTVREILASLVRDGWLEVWQ
jgi:hypothetical protein